MRSPPRSPLLWPLGSSEDTDDGFAHGGWSIPFFDLDSMGPAIGEALSATDALLFGRRTWETMAAAWPERAGDPFADRMNEIPKYVASRTLAQENLDWTNSTLLPADDVVGAVRRMRDLGGGDVQVMGSPTLAATLIINDLVDEYRLMIEPIVLGGGKRLFPADGISRTLQLVSTSTSRTGVHMCTYRPVGAPNPPARHRGPTSLQPQGGTTGPCQRSSRPGGGFSHSGPKCGQLRRWVDTVVSTLPGGHPQPSR